MKWDKGSVIAVLEAIAQHGEISRAMLSEVTGFSQVTVGKAVDFLASAGMLNQYKQARGSAGRKAAVCRLETGRGMLLVDLTGEKTVARICDIALDIKNEYANDSGELADTFITGFGTLVEAFGDGMIGIGCVVPNGTKDKYTRCITEALGHEPELIIEEDTAYAIANAKRFDCTQVAMYLRLFENGYITSTVMFGDIPYEGFHNKAGKFSYIASSREALCRQIADILAVIDPELIHIACESEEDAVSLPLGISSILSGYGEEFSENITEVIVEPMQLCRTAMDGAGMQLRENYALSKM